MVGQGAVLVVDDEPDIAALLAAVMESEGYRSLRAASGREALELALANKPRAIVLDLSLPDLDGVHVLRMLKGHPETVSIPVIVVSAYTGRLGTSDRGLAQAVLEKPFDLDELAAAMAGLPDPEPRPATRAGSRPRRLRRPAATAA